MSKKLGFHREPGQKKKIKGPTEVARLTQEVRERIEGVKILILDVDGVLTDGRLFYHDDGTETKAFDVRDGHGIKMIQRAGVEVALISGRATPSVEKRARDLGIAAVFQNIKDKVPVFESILEERGLSPEEAAFVGDDVVDIPVMSRVGFSVAVAGGSEHVVPAAHYVTLAPGGRGAVREVTELIIAVQGKWEDILGRYFG